MVDFAKLNADRKAKQEAATQEAEASSYALGQSITQAPATYLPPAIPLDFDVKVVLDSVCIPTNKRITTLAITYPRFIHSEVLTHRDRARNSASSRAIPWPKMRKNVATSPVIPLIWGSEQKGMQTGGQIAEPHEATTIWLEARDNALASADKLASLGVHKSLVNRLIEPFMWITVVMTATEWNNLWRLRCHTDAEVHFQKIAGMMRDAMVASNPQKLMPGDWHIPYAQADEMEELSKYYRDYVDNGADITPYHHYLDMLCRASTARCARVSYLTHGGIRSMIEDLGLFDKLVNGSGFGHYSPFEHPAQAHGSPHLRSGPFIGWEQYRKQFPLENIPG